MGRYSQSVPLLPQCINPDFALQRSVIQGRRDLQSLHSSNNSFSYCLTSASWTKVMNNPQLRVIQKESGIGATSVGLIPYFGKLEEVSTLWTKRSGLDWRDGLLRRGLYPPSLHRLLHPLIGAASLFQVHHWTRGRARARAGHELVHRRDYLLPLLSSNFLVGYIHQRL